ncbi:cytochrome c oxidase subunit IV family [Globomyces pollinis-pini]|nr:cytochrome c oxidase subunit IV family [Globomyces pollinis-pini]KAJ3000258.1 Cytochrome c oxidase subunit 5A [Globomyces sp. JEL0801]
MLRLPTRISTLAQKRFNSTTVNALTELESRWVKLPDAEQGAIADHLAELQKGDWKKMTLEQKRAAYYIAYGTYGARAPTDPTLKWRVAGWTLGLTGIAYVLWIIFEKNKPRAISETPEWAAAEAQLAIERKQNPHRGPYKAYLDSQK